MHDYLSFIPLYQNPCSLYYSIYISSGADKQNLFNNQELLLFMIIPPIIMTLMFNQGVKV